MDAYFKLRAQPIAFVIASGSRYSLPPINQKAASNLRGRTCFKRVVSRKILSHHHVSDRLALSFWLFWDTSHTPKHVSN
jgi:hypothetical protein